MAPRKWVNRVIGENNKESSAQCEYQDFAEELMRDQFIACLTSDALRVKLIESTGTKPLKQSWNYATTFANQLMKTARNTQQEQIKYTTKSPQSSQCFWWGEKHQQPRQQNCPACVQGWTQRQARQQLSNFVSEDTEEETLVTECDKAQRFARKYFAKLQLKHGEKTKVLRAQIDSASTCNNISSTPLRKLFPNAETRRIRSKIKNHPYLPRFRAQGVTTVTPGCHLG